ncbi:MAG: fibronectin type III domain-containing protein, partial [Candidatus Thorarchaeota archaeon]
KGSGAFFNPNHLLNWIEIFLGLDLMYEGTYNALAFQDVAQWMLAGPLYEPVVVLLTGRSWVMSNPGDSHFVVAYDYETHSNGSIQIYIYNCNEIYTGPENMYNDWIMLDPDGTFQGIRSDPEAQWHIMCAYERSPEYNSILSALIELLPKALGLLVLSPVDVQITDPAGRRIGVDEDGNRLNEFPAMYSEDEDGHKSILMPYVPGVPYTINLTGTDEGDYTLITNRVVDGELVTETVQGQTSPGESDIFSVSVEGDGLNLAKQGITLYAPTILSGTAVELEWTEYDEPDFDHYEIYVSKSVDEIGNRLDVEINSRDETSYRVTGLTPESTYFFTVRVNTTSGPHADSNRVGAVMPEDITYLLLIAAGVGGLAVFLIVLVLWRRRRSSS